ncbi:MAG: rhomboid family intramembrane serine protease [Desulfuromonadales bacterium]|nr:rhomboid family intramembrane serine protease [Desulfuromonadales bacterium]
METTRYRIVFRGEVGLGYNQDEIRENLARLTRWDDKKIAQLLSSSHCVIKSDLDAATADRMLNSLNNTGIICRKEAVPNANPENPAAAAAISIAVVGREAPGTGDASQACPKCGHPRQGGESCPDCGVVYARFASSRQGAAREPAASPSLVSAQAVMLQRSAKRRTDPLARLEERHPLGYYYGKLQLVVVGALLLRTLYAADLTSLILLLLPLGFALYLGALSAVVDRPFEDLLTEHRSLLPLPLTAPEERTAPFPFATYGLVFLHIMLYFGLQRRTPVEILQQYWFFPPLDSSTANLVVSTLASLFFHTSGWAFLGGIFFLWVIGATLERRIGSGLLVGFYLLGGLLAASFGVGVQQLFPGATLQIIGSGGALAALLGVFAICSHRRIMTFPLPLGRLESFLVGTPCQVRWSSLLVAGLFVFADLGAPVEEARAGRSALGPLILLAGFLGGLSGAYALGLGSKAGDEEEESLPGGLVFAAKEATLRQRLAANPDNPDLLVQLARVVSAEKLTDEGRQLYRRAINGRLSSKPKEATEIYREFNRRHQEVFEPKLTLRLASLYLRQGDTGMAASVLSSVCDDERTSVSELEKALYQYVVALAKIREIDAAQAGLQRFSQTFAESSLLPKLREVVYDAAHSEPG